MSSRNLLLSKSGMIRCGTIYEILQDIKNSVREEEGIEEFLSEQKQKLTVLGFTPEYLEIYDCKTIKKVTAGKNITKNCRVFCVAHFGTVRLIDNVLL